jgi:hypothetical protein
MLITDANLLKIAICSCTGGTARATTVSNFKLQSKACSTINSLASNIPTSVLALTLDNSTMHEANRGLDDSASGRQNISNTAQLRQGPGADPVETIFSQSHVSAWAKMSLSASVDKTIINRRFFEMYL